MENKKEWPELVGQPGEVARNTILAEDSSINAQVIPENSAVTRDYRIDRVRIFVNEQGIVVRTPRRG